MIWNEWFIFKNLVKWALTEMECSVAGTTTLDREWLITLASSFWEEEFIVIFFYSLRNSIGINPGITLGCGFVTLTRYYRKCCTKRMKTRHTATEMSEMQQSFCVMSGSCCKKSNSLTFQCLEWKIILRESHCWFLADYHISFAFRIIVLY